MNEKPRSSRERGCAIGVGRQRTGMHGSRSHRAWAFRRPMRTARDIIGRRTDFLDPRTPMSDLDHAVDTIIADCLGVAPGEDVLVVADPPRPRELGDALRDRAAARPGPTRCSR